MDIRVEDDKPESVKNVLGEPMAGPSSFEKVAWGGHRFAATVPSNAKREVVRAELTRDDGSVRGVAASEVHGDRIERCLAEARLAVDEDLELVGIVEMRRDCSSSRLFHQIGLRQALVTPQIS